MSLPVAAIVPAYNEEKTVGTVVRTLVQAGVFEQVIVVDDGSTDRTSDVAAQAGATRVVRSPRNSGKGRAMALGVQSTKLETLCFFDADLIGLTADHLRQLISPVIAGELAMHIGTVDRGPIVNALSRRLPAVSGQRALRREVFTNIPSRHVAGFGIEMALNYSCHLSGWPRRRCYLSGVTVVRKTQKVGLCRGLRGYVRMWYRVLERAVLIRLDRQQFGGQRK
ncbi:MAG: glycosyltransferase family 2 protein [Patescibacteria group bacterium]